MRIKRSLGGDRAYKFRPSDFKSIDQGLVNWDAKIGCAWTLNIQRINTDCFDWLGYVFKLRKNANADLGLDEPVGGQDEFSGFRVRMH
jgi:hypothetical protein